MRLWGRPHCSPQVRARPAACLMGRACCRPHYVLPRRRPGAHASSQSARLIAHLALAPPLQASACMAKPDETIIESAIRSARLVRAAPQGRRLPGASSRANNRPSCPLSPGSSLWKSVSGAAAAATPLARTWPPAQSIAKVQAGARKATRSKWQPVSSAAWLLPSRVRDRARPVFTLEVEGGARKKQTRRQGLAGAGGGAKRSCVLGPRAALRSIEKMMMTAIKFILHQSITLMVVRMCLFGRAFANSRLPD